MDFRFFRETPWETRNLSCKAYEVQESSLTSTDENFSLEFEQIKKQNTAFFCFARTKTTNIQLINTFLNSGFQIIETTLSPILSLKKSQTLQAFLNAPNQFIPFFFKNNDIVFTPNENCAPILSEIKDIARGSFSMDRFHVDPICPHEIANNRFSFWIDDLLGDNGVEMDTLRVDGKVVCFFARKSSQLILTGFHKDYVNSGLGEYLWLNSLSQLLLKGERTAKTLISVNNLAVLNLYVKLGFSFKNPQYSFHFWQQNVLSK